MKIIVISVLLTFLIPLCAQNKKNLDVENVLEMGGYDIDSKSYSGWLRLFHNKENLKRYKLDYLSDETIDIYILQLETLNKNKIVGKLK